MGGLTTIKACLITVLFLAFFLPAAHLAWTARDMPQLGHFHDDGLYWVSAKSLAEGSGYRLLSLPGVPAATKYPPLFPLYLSIVWRWSPSFPQNLPWLALFAWLPYPLLAVVVWRFFAELTLPRPARWLGCTLLALSPNVVFLSTVALSDLLFCSFVLMALMLVERCLREEVSLWVVALAGALAGVAYLTRSVAVLLLVSAPVAFLFRRKFRAASIFAASMMPAVLSWMIWTARNYAPDAPDAPGTDPALLYYTNYIGFFRRTVGIADLRAVFLMNVNQFFDSVGNLFLFGLDGSFFGVQLARLLTFACIAGIVRLVAQGKARHYALFGVLYSVILLFWNYGPTERLVLPIFPLLLAGFLTEMGHILQLLLRSWRDRKVSNRVAAVLAAATVAAFAAYLAFENQRTIRKGFPAFFEATRPVARTNREAYGWISANTPADAVFFAYNDPIFYLYTGRHACRIPPNPVDLYHQDLPAVLNRFRRLDDFAAQWKLTHALLTDTDYDTDFPDSVRKQTTEILHRDPSLQTVASFPAASVRRFDLAH